jgi:hypothetical protein
MSYFNNSGATARLDHLGSVVGPARCAAARDISVAGRCKTHHKMCIASDGYGATGAILANRGRLVLDAVAGCRDRAGMELERRPIEATVRSCSDIGQESHGPLPVGLGRPAPERPAEFARPRSTGRRPQRERGNDNTERHSPEPVSNDHRLDRIVPMVRGDRDATRSRSDDDGKARKVMSAESGKEWSAASRRGDRP